MKSNPNTPRENLLPLQLRHLKRREENTKISIRELTNHILKRPDSVNQNALPTYKASLLTSGIKNSEHQVTQGVNEHKPIEKTPSDPEIQRLKEVLNSNEYEHTQHHYKIFNILFSLIRLEIKYYKLTGKEKVITKAMEGNLNVLYEYVVKIIRSISNDFGGESQIIDLFRNTDEDKVFIKIFTHQIIKAKDLNDKEIGKKLEAIKNTITENENLVKITNEQWTKIVDIIKKIKQIDEEKDPLKELRKLIIDLDAENLLTNLK